MPHQCTECSRTFPDGSKEMLAGCPNCGGNKFQFRPKGSVSDFEEPTPTSAQPKSSDSSKTRTTTLREWAREKVSPSGTAPGGTGSSSSGQSTSIQTTKPAASQSNSPKEEDRQTVTSSTTKLDNFGSEASESAAGEPAADSTDGGNGVNISSDNTHEDSAQADARRGIVTEDELPDPPAEPDEVEPATEREPRPDLSQLREELNDQFESIKVVEPGQYELNLMELYDRDEYIIALQENGRYVIEVPDAWKASE